MEGGKASQINIQKLKTKNPGKIFSGI